MEIDPYENDPARWAHSLAHLTEILVPCLDAAGARSVVEVGAYAGDLTRVLLQWAAGADARVYAVDPTPHESLVRLAAERDDLELIRETSLQALPHIPLPDAVVIDGDHNYYTVEHELEAIGARAEGADMPLLFLHDVGWPHGRRDSYFAPERIPEADRQEIAEGGGLMPGVQGIRPGGLPYRAAAAREGGARNGVRTAVEDFVKGRQGLQLAIVPAFFGLGWCGIATASGRTLWSPPWSHGTTTACWGGSRTIGCTTSHTGTSRPHRPRVPRSGRRARRLCFAGCWSRVPSEWPNDCRAYVSEPESPLSSRSSRRTPSAGCSGTRPARDAHAVPVSSSSGSTAAAGL